MLTEKQHGVLRGVVVGAVVTLLALALAVVAHPAALTPERGYAAAFVHALKWDVLLVVCLVANVGRLANHRFFTPEDIDGGGIAAGTPQAKVFQSILQNTLEQTVLGLSTHMIWAATMPQHWQAAVSAAAILFFVGRVLFWRGYAHGASARALGFALTFYPSVAMLLLVVGHLTWAVIQ